MALSAGNQIGEAECRRRIRHVELTIENAKGETKTFMSGLPSGNVPKAAVAGGMLQVSDLYGRGDAYIMLALK